MWGFRQTASDLGSSGSNGAAVTIHRDAAGIVIENNIIFDVPNAISIFTANPKRPEEWVENIVIRNNLIYDIRQFSKDKWGGLAVYVSGDIKLSRNSFLNIEKNTIKTRLRKPYQIENNITINDFYTEEMEKVVGVIFLDPTLKKKLRPFEYNIKQITVPEKVRLRFALLPE